MKNNSLEKLLISNLSQMVVNCQFQLLFNRTTKVKQSPRVAKKYRNGRSGISFWHQAKSVKTTVTAR